MLSGSVPNREARTNPPRKRNPGYGRLMNRSKKWRSEWTFFLSENDRRQYNKFCKDCVYPCKQSFWAVVVSCPLSKVRELGLKIGEETACGGKVE